MVVSYLNLVVDRMKMSKYEQTTNFHKWNDERKAQAFPLHLEGSASIWFNSIPDIGKKTYAEMLTALRQHYHSSAEVYFLRQRLNARKQLPNESVASYASDILRLAQRINLPTWEVVNYFTQGLRPDLRWCYTGQLATPTCNGDWQHMFFARICRHVTLLNRFQKFPTRCSTANITKNRSQRGVTLERFFARHRIIASWRCKLTV